MKRTCIVAPSLLASSFLNLGDDIARIDASGAEWVHLDVMDGQFVPKISFGSDIVKSVASICKSTIDVHLMVDNPEQKLEFFAKAGAQYITVHAEACTHLHRCIQTIRDMGIHPGIALLPSTPVSNIEPIIHLVDIVLVMTVNPGYGGQELLEFCLEKVKLLDDIRRIKKCSYFISVDGGIDTKTGKKARDAGVDVLVSGTKFFNHHDPKEYVSLLKG